MSCPENSGHYYYYYYYLFLFLVLFFLFTIHIKECGKSFNPLVLLSSRLPYVFYEVCVTAMTNGDAPCCKTKWLL